MTVACFFYPWFPDTVVKRKPVPTPPATRDALEAYQRALPLVPGSEDDCCARLQSHADVADRSSAGEWLDFLCALGLAQETETGFVRTRDDPESVDLATNFRAGVVLADEVLDVLETVDGGQTADDLFDAVREDVPRWERQKRDDWQAVWRARTHRLCEWAVLLGLTEKRSDGYVRSDGEGRP